MQQKIKTFHDLNIWNKGMEIVADIYQTTRSFPNDEIYGLTAQMKRCSAELETQIRISYRLGFIIDKQQDNLLEKVNHLNRMTINLIKCL